MSYSFIKPRVKPLFSLFTRIWLWAMFLIGAAFISGAIFIGMQIFNINLQSDELQTQYDAKLKAINDLKNQTKITSVKRDMTLDIYHKNAILNKSLMNLFNLVPDGVTLKSIYMEEHTLKVKGLTPTKDRFKLLFEAPLKSIFAVSNTTFYQLPNGWYNFVSINKNSPDGEIDK